MAFDYLKYLGEASEEIKKGGGSILAKVAFKFADESVDSMKQLVPKATMTLENSLTYDYKEEDGKLIIYFLADDYWDFVNSGVEGVRQSAGSLTNQYGSVYQFKKENPSPSMVEAFGGGANYGKNGEQGDMQNWMAIKGIIADDGDYNSLAYSIALMVKRFGIKPTPFVDQAFDETKIRAFEEALLDAFESII